MNSGLVILIVVVAVVAVIAILAFVIYRALNPKLKKDEEKKDENEAAAEELKRILQPIDDAEVEESMRQYDEKLQQEEQAEVKKDQTPKEGK